MDCDEHSGIIPAAARAAFKGTTLLSVTKRTEMGMKWALHDTEMKMEDQKEQNCNQQHRWHAKPLHTHALVGRQARV